MSISKSLEIEREKQELHAPHAMRQFVISSQARLLGYLADSQLGKSSVDLFNLVNEP